MSKVLDLNKEDFSKEVLENEGVVLVDFWAEWCMPCKMMAPVLDEIAASLADKVKVVKVNVAENEDLASEYGVQSIPDIRIFKNGKIVGELVGMQSKANLEKKIEEIL
jgi:thioredoxin 1